MFPFFENTLVRVACWSHSCNNNFIWLKEKHLTIIFQRYGTFWFSFASSVLLFFIIIIFCTKVSHEQQPRIIEWKKYKHIFYLNYYSFSWLFDFILHTKFVFPILVPRGRDTYRAWLKLEIIIKTFEIICFNISIR